MPVGLLTSIYLVEYGRGWLAKTITFLVRDKDGNSACLMFAEVCAWVKSRGLTVPEYLDEIYSS